MGAVTPSIGATTERDLGETVVCASLAGAFALHAIETPGGIVTALLDADAPRLQVSPGALIHGRVVLDFIDVGAHLKPKRVYAPGRQGVPVHPIVA